MRTTRSKTRMRRSHHRVSKPATTVDGDGVRHFKHRASAQTGKYRGRQVVDVEKKIAKKQAKQASKGREEESSE